MPVRWRSAELLTLTLANSAATTSFGDLGRCRPNIDDYVFVSFALFARTVSRLIARIGPPAPPASTGVTLRMIKSPIGADLQRLSKANKNTTAATGWLLNAKTGIPHR